MNEPSRTAKTYAPASGPDVAARLRHAMEANMTTRMVLAEGVAMLSAINLHLDQLDAHLQQLIDDLEGRARDEG
jgi:hypothetical protein